MIVVLTGAPGAGKGTQAQLLVDKAGFRKVSTGDSLRKHVREGSDIGKLAQPFLDRGDLVPDDVLLKILQAEIGTKPEEKIILDGYPRNIAQAEALDKILDGSHSVEKALNIDVKKDVLIKRLSGRRVCPKDGATYHVTDNPPASPNLCNKCNSELIRRTDDEASSVLHRLDVYEKQTLPILKYYENTNKLSSVDGDQACEKVYTELLDLLD